MECLHCRSKGAQRKCTVCGAYYCYEICQKLHWPKHKLVCFPHQHQRIAAFVKHEIKEAMLAGWIPPMATITNHGGISLIGVSPFPVDMFTSNLESCALCKSSRARRDVYYRRRMILESGVIVVYHRCDLCIEEDRLLCPVTWKTHWQCTIDVVASYLALMTCLKRIGASPCKDIRQLIWTMASHEGHVCIDEPDVSKTQ
jgi:hypothetical protein